MDDSPRAKLERDTLLMHASGRPGKIEISPTKPLVTQRDLSLAYSPRRGRSLPAHRPRSQPGL